MKLSILIPVYNEEKTILKVLNQINNQNFTKFSFEIIVIDDGSTDNTSNVLSQNVGLYDKCVSLEKNSGKGAAIKLGLKYATGDYVIFQDGDLEYDPKEFNKIVDVIQKFGAEIVIGSRFLSPDYTRVHNYFHKQGNKFITFLFNLLNNTTFTDIYSCYLCFKKPLLDENMLKSNGWDQQAELLSIIIKNAKIYYEVPIAYSGRSYSEGKKIKARHVFKVIYTIFKKKLL